MNIFLKIVRFLCFFSVIFSQNLLASESKQKTIITTVRSKTIDLHKKSNKIEFNDDVVVERGDTSFLADKMVVYYADEDADDKSDDVEKIDAMGNVKIFNQEFVATGEAGVYNPKTGIFTVQNNVIFNNGISIAQGKKFTYNVNSKQSYLLGDKKSEEDLKDSRVIVIIDEETTQE